ncbi:hypothetical protein [Stenotrophomonas sp.]|uniref:hypothetical protein n=1 Tax=Stenotrophomonas sp. TaxID=69392 RepID=UPI0028AA2CAA|nr:hypothetical protein [Stenotrophomonas sp.]
MPALGGDGLRLRRVSAPEAAVIGEHLVCYGVHNPPSTQAVLADHGTHLKAEWLRLLDHWTCCAANSLRQEAVALRAQGGEAPASWAAYLVAARCLLQGELEQVLDSSWCASLLQLEAPLPPSLRSALLHALDLQIHAGGVLDDAGRARANEVLEELYPALQGPALEAMRHTLLAHLFASLHRQAIAENTAGTEFRVIHLHVPPT